MKRIVSLFILFLTLVSCSSDEAIATGDVDFFGNWNLTKMSSAFTPAISFSDGLEWEESYDFNENGTFTKTRLRDNKSITVSGTYKVTTTQNEVQFELTYEKDNDIIGTCSKDSKEILYINSSRKLYSTWQNCDGPELVYEKEK
ncbi:hypothetical protein [Flavobacterium hungaricum]|uniref:Lipocalin-like domain-containing protein n=1 Tax=Flavobacterium hungaricum TaxID=2082725 RepID=A0ABR9TGY7_9FLAO|nr:hypothetical protein [Flavobacterium hungaricum]MBE8724605.1 hypothetical protein [Flavobacterium hungaricum]